jgi:hypothetical protein
MVETKYGKYFPQMLPKEVRDMVDWSEGGK